MHRRSSPPIGRAFTLAAIALSIGAAACRDNNPVAPQRAPYIAIISSFTTAPGLPTAGPIRFTVEELSGTLGIRHMLSARRGDTLIIAVPPASYVVEILDLPSTCSVRDGPKKLITLLETDNTGTLRYNVSCLPSLTIEVLMDGHELDTQLVYRVAGPGTQRLGFVDLSGSDSVNVRGDTIRFDRLPPGDYEISLSQVGDNCIFSGQGPSDRSLALAAVGGQTVTFRLRCSETAARPRILSLASSYHDSVSAFVLRVVDPDRDLTSYTWDLTDCRGNSILSEGTPRIRRGLDAGRTQRADTVLIVGAFESGIADSLLRGRCTAIQVEDQRGNTTELREQPIAASRGGSAPEVIDFNAVLRGTQSLATSLTASDPDGDFAGTFAAIRVRDGVLGPFDGSVDIGILSVAGFLDTRIPDVSLGSRIRWDDVYAVIVYLVDHAGNFTKREDTNLSR